MELTTKENFMKNPLTSLTRRANLPVMHNPWRAMTELQNEMDRWFGNTMSAFPEIPSGFDFSPTADFQESDKEFALKLDIPGIKKEDVKIEVENNTLTVSGERKDQKEEKDSKRHFSESFYGSFLRSFTLAQVIDESTVKAEYKDGVLNITVPKASPTNAKTIAIQ
jgi:HSP20 family protein